MGTRKLGLACSSAAGLNRQEVAASLSPMQTALTTQDGIDIDTSFAALSISTQAQSRSGSWTTPARKAQGWQTASRRWRAHPGESRRPCKPAQLRASHAVSILQQADLDTADRAAPFGTTSVSVLLWGLRCVQPAFTVALLLPHVYAGLIAVPDHTTLAAASWTVPERQKRWRCLCRFDKLRLQADTILFCCRRRGFLRAPRQLPSSFAVLALSLLVSSACGTATVPGHPTRKLVSQGELRIQCQSVSHQSVTVCQSGTAPLVRLPSYACCLCLLWL